MADDAAIKQAAHIPQNEPLPHVSLDQSLGKTKEIVQAVAQFQKTQEDAEKRASKEVKSHAQTKEKIKSVEMDHARAVEALVREQKQHAVSADKLSAAEREHMKTRDVLTSQRHEVSSMLLHMEALKVEMEAQRKAFVVNVNWASRCTELKGKFDTSRSDYEKLYDQHMQAMNALEIAQKAQEDHRTKAVKTLEALDEANKELGRQAELLSGNTKVTPEVQKKLDEWKEYKAVQGAEEIAKKQGRSKAMGVLERQLADGDTGVMMNYLNAWEAYTRDEVKQRKYKDQAMKRAMKNIANEGMGLLSQVFAPWKKETEQQKRHALALANKKLEEANARSGGSAAIARKKALAQLEKQFIGQDKALTKSAFQGWADGQAMRKKKDANMKAGARMIANSGKALLAEIIMTWNSEAETTRQKGKVKAANNAKAARMIAGSSKAVVAHVFQEWAGWVKAAADERKLKAAGNSKAARMMANSDASLTNIIFDSWMKLQQERRKKDAGNKKAARMISGSNGALTVTCFKGWAGMCTNKKAKDAGTAKAVRMIAASGEALQAACFKSWADHIRKSREKNKKLRAVEKTIGASAEGSKLLTFSAWRNTVIVDMRQKSAKKRAMQSSMKSITSNQDLLMVQVCMSWARAIAADIVNRLQEKVTAAQNALDEAMVKATKAIEEDVGKCQEEAENLKKELDKVVKQFDEAKAKAAGMEQQIGEEKLAVTSREKHLAALVVELEESRKKAASIGEELAKVGIFLQSAGPRKKTSRPQSGAKADGLPQIGAGGRPMSARKP